MSDVPSKKFLQLIKVSLDDSANVVRDFADCKVIALSEYGGSVIKFLDLKKHDLYHKWQIYKPCCCCGGNKFEKAEIREQIQQLTAIVSVSLNEKRSSTDTQYPASSNNKDKIQIRASCKVEGKNIDESAAIQSLSDSKHDNPLDLSFSIKSAEKKCILLELEVPSEVLKDKVLFRVALRKLIVKIAHAGNVDINKQSTITLQLTFKDDLSEDIIKEIQALSNNSDMSCDMNRSIECKYN
ncbi:unnamed protein product [Mytilus edulis]|uniref:Uncharacterized protein n=1 Tax=Mytilus edulis TaxID=6550 RepID=A0A8S3RJW7_MYTED|nr:unnamed protein product [Mytilus edulis]